MIMVLAIVILLAKMIKIVESKTTLMMGMNNMLNDISNDNGGDDKDNYINN